MLFRTNNPKSNQLSNEQSDFPCPSALNGRFGVQLIRAREHQHPCVGLTSTYIGAGVCVCVCRVCVQEGISKNGQLPFEIPLEPPLKGTFNKQTRIHTNTCFFWQDPMGIYQKILAGKAMIRWVCRRWLVIVSMSELLTDFP